MSAEEKIAILENLMKLLDDAKSIAIDVTDHPFMPFAQRTKSNYPWDLEDELDSGLGTAWYAAYKMRNKLKKGA